MDICKLVIGTSTIDVDSLGFDPESSVSAAEFAVGDQGDVSNPYPAVTAAGTDPSGAPTVPVVGALTGSKPSSPIKLKNGMLSTIGDETFVINPSAISVAATTVLPGRPGFNIAETPLSLGSSEVLSIGSNTMSIQASNTLRGLNCNFKIDLYSPWSSSHIESYGRLCERNHDHTRWTWGYDCCSVGCFGLFRGAGYW